MAGLFDTSEFDDLFASINKTVNEIDNKVDDKKQAATGRSNRKPIEFKPFMKGQAKLPDTDKLEIVHDRTKIDLLVVDPAKSMSLEEFFTLLSEAAPNFTYGYDRERDHGPTYIRLWSGQGLSFDPITAVALYKLKTHYNLAMWDHAAAALGLMPDVACLVSESCLLGVTDSHMLMRRNIFAALGGKLHLLKYDFN